MGGKGGRWRREGRRVQVEWGEKRTEMGEGREKGRRVEVSSTSAQSSECLFEFKVIDGG